MLCLVVFFSGCTTVEVSTDVDKLTLDRRFGFVSVKVPAERPLVTAKVTGFGYVSGPLGYSLGYTDQATVTADRGCAMVVWLDETTNERLLIEQLEAIEGVCLASQ